MRPVSGTNGLPEHEINLINSHSCMVLLPINRRMSLTSVVMLTETVDSTSFSASAFRISKEILVLNSF
jgi:hypothetical protein